MSPFRTGSSSKSTKQEDKILLALKDVKNGRIKSYNTLYTSSHNRVSRTDIRSNDHKLTQFEGDSLTEWILSIDTCGAVPRPATVG